jgi:hypothetical protein
LAVASPNKSVWLNTGRALWFELPDTYAQLSSGELSERVAETIVSETRHLDAEKRGEVDQQLKAVGVSKLGSRRQPYVSARSPMRLIGGVMCSGAAPNVNIVGLGCGQHPTPWQCSPATFRWNKESPATPHSNNTPTQRLRPETVGAGPRDPGHQSGT